MQKAVDLHPIKMLIYCLNYLLVNKKQSLVTTDLPALIFEKNCFYSDCRFSSGIFKKYGSIFLVGGAINNYW